MVITGLSANELYCIIQKGFKPGNIVYGNAMHFLEAIKSLESNIKTSIGQELRHLTKLITEARKNAFERMLKEVTHKYIGIIQVNSHLRPHPNHMEFLSSGSIIDSVNSFSSGSNGQDLYAELDAGYKPISFVFGSITYSMQPHGFFSSLKHISKGEMKSLSDKLSQVRNKALNQLVAAAKEKNANAVLGIKISLNPFDDRACEMLMTGTASFHSSFTHEKEINTSHLSAIETWSLAKMGYVPVRLLLETSVYSLGLPGKMSAPWRTLTRSENDMLSKMVEDARIKAINTIKEKADKIHADDVIGVKTFINPLGNGLIEVLAIGTAIKKMPEVKTESEQLPAQAIVFEKNIFNRDIDTIKMENTFLKSFVRIIVIVLIILGLVWLSHHQ